MTILRVRIGVGDFAEVSQRLVVASSLVKGGADGELAVRRKRIYGERPLLLSQRRAELAPVGKQVPVGLVGEGVVRVQGDGAAKLLFRRTPRPVQVQQR